MRGSLSRENFSAQLAIALAHHQAIAHSAKFHSTKVDASI